MDRRLLLQLAAALSLTFASIFAMASAARADAAGIEVSEAFSRATIGQATSGVIYLTLVNRASRPDRLIAASTPAAARTDLHVSERAGEVMRMRRVETLDIDAGEAVAFEPGGAHIMLSGLVQPLREGDSLALTLEFEAAGAITIEVPVRSIAAGSAKTEDGHEAH